MTTASGCVHRPGKWPTTRILFVLAGTVTLASVALTVTLSAWFLLLTAFVGVNQLVYVVVGSCPASLVIERLRTPARTGMLDAHHTEET